MPGQKCEGGWGTEAEIQEEKEGPRQHRVGRRAQLRRPGKGNAGK